MEDQDPGTQIGTTDQVALQVAREATQQGHDVHLVTVQHVTAGLYTVELYLRGVNEPERFVYVVDTDDLQRQ